jgi:hypothetical protein
MFTKLLKYELKTVGKWYFALNAAVLAISIFLGFSIKSFAEYAQDSTYIDNNVSSQLILFCLVLVFGILVAGAWIATFFIIIRHFYKNVFGREGYLTLTLPVSSHQIILSKLLASFIWVVFNSVILIIGIVLVILPISGVGNFLVYLPYIFTDFKILDFLMLALYSILSVLSGILLIYVAISIGQLFSNKRGLMSFLAYFLLIICGFILSSVISNPFLHVEEYFTFRFFTYYCIEYLIRILIFYFGTYYIMKNKLNLQ